MKALTTWTRKDGQYYLLKKVILHPETSLVFLSCGSQVMRFPEKKKFYLCADFFTLPKVGKSGKPHNYMQFPERKAS